MADIVVRKENGGALAPRTEWNPGQLIRNLMQWDPFREMMPSFPNFPSAELAFAPAFEVKETKSGYTFTADLPGVEEKDIDISRTGNRLTVTGKRESEHEDKSDSYYVCERSYGSFSRSFTMPDGIDGDHIQAHLKNGVLSLIVPKTTEAQTKRISLKSTTEKKS